MGAQLNRRDGEIRRTLGSYLAPAASYTINAYNTGAQVASGSSGTTITVRAGHGFKATDKWLKNPGSDNTFSGTNTVASVTTTTVVMNSAVTVAAGDILFNLGADTGTSAPNFDQSRVTIYSDMDGTTSIANASVTTNSQGEYGYFYSEAGIWELVRSGTTVLDYWRETGSERLVRKGTGNWNVILNPNRDVVSGYTLGDTATTAASPIMIERDNDIDATLGSRASEIAFYREKKQRWAIGEDVTDGDRSFFALWCDKGGSSGGAWVTGDILGVSYAGADSGRVSPAGVDGPKWRFNSSFSPASGPNEYDDAYQYQFFCPTIQTSGEGMYSAAFYNSLDSINGGGVLMQVSGDRTGLQVKQVGSGRKTGRLELGAGSGNSFYVGCDIPGADAVTFSIFDRAASAYRLFIDASGNVGFGGVTSLTNTVELQKNQNATTRIACINTTDGASSRASVACFGNGSESIGMEYYNPSFSDATVAGDGMLSTSGTGAQLHLGTGGARRVTISDSAAMMGIGCDPPTTTLDVNGALRLRSTAVNVTGNDAVATANISMIELTNVSGTNTITLNAPSSVTGHILTLHLAALTAGTLTLADSGNVALSAAWVPDAGDTLTLQARGAVWYELCRSAN